MKTLARVEADTKPVLTEIDETNPKHPTHAGRSLGALFSSRLAHADELRDIAARLRGSADAFRSSPDRMLETRHDAAARLNRIAAELEAGRA